MWIVVKQSVSSAGERKTVPRCCQNKSLSFKIKELQKDELKGKNKVNKCLCAPCYNWIIWSSLVRSGSIVSVLGKAEISWRGPAYITCRVPGRCAGLSSGGGRGLFWLLANGGSEFNLKEWLGSPQGSCGQMGDFSPAPPQLKSFVLLPAKTQTPTQVLLAMSSSPLGL